MSNLILPTDFKTGIFKCLKAGVNVEFPEQGTPQGGVVSPLLANIALNGIESLGEERDHRGFSKSNNITSIRYADDMVIILKPQHDATQTLEKIKEFLAARGMEVSEQKTKITATTDGFDFLGWNFKVQSNGKFRSTPSEANFKAFRKKIKTIINCSNYGATVKATKLAPIVRGWRQYHKFCKMDGSRNSLWHINHRAYMVFNKETKQDRYTSEALIKKAFPSVPYSENKFVKVKGDASPYDGNLIYWSERNSKLYDGLTSKVLKKQSHSCAVCECKFMSDERVHLHHIDGNHRNWKSQNLVAIHESCLDYTHMSKTILKR